MERPPLSADHDRLYTPALEVEEAGTSFARRTTATKGAEKRPMKRLVTVEGAAGGRLSIWGVPPDRARKIETLYPKGTTNPLPHELLERRILAELDPADESRVRIVGLADPVTFYGVDVETDRVL
jgi:hypothetical protein